MQLTDFVCLWLLVCLWLFLVVVWIPAMVRHGK